MRYEKPGASFEATLDNAPAGLVGTLGIRVTHDSATVTARTTAGIVEYPAGSGVYTATLTAPSTEGDYRIVWDTGGLTPSWASEDLEVVANPPTISASSGYTTPNGVRLILAAEGNTDPSTAASLSDEELQEAIDEGAVEINARLGSRYSVPFAGAVPSLIEKMNRDIAAFMANLVFRRGNPVDVDDPVRLRYNRARDLLNQLAKGEVELLGASGPIAASSSEVAVENVLYDGNLFALEDFDLGPVDSVNFDFYRYRSRG
jgi:phage gp36-like protein